MKATIHHTTGDYEIDFSEPIDISIHTSNSDECTKAWYVDAVKIAPVLTDQFVGSVKDGGSVNFRNIYFNPHGNTTHTECVGHISEEVFDLQKHLTNYFFKAQLITVLPECTGEDFVITLDSIKSLITEGVDAIIIRTLPNKEGKKKMQWSGTNWAYLDPSIATHLADLGIKHLLIDLPSIDKEIDGGKLLAHHAFWKYPNQTRFDATITEMIFVPNMVEDGIFFLSLQPASFVNDASPCKPVIYKVKK